jgi:hypothetical protein
MRSEDAINENVGRTKRARKSKRKRKKSGNKESMATIRKRR